MENWQKIQSYDGVLETINPVSSPVTGVSIDSRTLEMGNVFFALRTEKADGHYFITDAINKGASIIVAAKDGKIPDPRSSAVSYWIVEDTLHAFQQMARLYRSQFDIPVVAITGSNGKTTTKEMLAEILSIKFNVLKNKGNFNNHLGVPITLFNLNSQHDVAIIEMGTNHIGEIGLLASITLPSIATVTNIGHAHIGNFPSIQQLAQEKKKLFEYINKHGGIIVQNMFDPFLNKDNYSTKTITIGPDSRSDIFSENIKIVPEKNGISFDLNGKIEIEMSIPGFHNRINALLAIGLAKSLGISIDECAERLRSFRTSDKRMEVQSVNGYTIINDCYNASPESMEEALRYVQQLASQQKRPLVLSLGDMLELGDDSPAYHKEIKKHIHFELINSIWLAGKDMASLALAIGDGNFAGGMHYALDAGAWMMDFVNRIPKNAIILVKASRGMQFEKVVKAILSGKG